MVQRPHCKYNVKLEFADQKYGHGKERQYRENKNSSEISEPRSMGIRKIRISGEKKKLKTPLLPPIISLPPSHPSQSISGQNNDKCFAYWELRVYVSVCFKRFIKIVALCAFSDVFAQLREGILRKNCCSFGFCPNYLPLPSIWTTCTNCTSFFQCRHSRFDSQFRTKNTIYALE